ncbi:MAG: 4Fe-4S dicluster domain-containing protein [Chloroflexi bacterium]|nr:4Fe-4S dicluster domain-containing protein [Chloroflexota bacterium]
MTEQKIRRRDFLKMIGAGIAVALGLRSKRTAASGPVGHSPYHWVMVIDQAKCIGCGYCTLACQAHNDAPPEIHWNRIIEVGKFEKKTVYLARPCMHCDHAPCVSACPVKASYKRADGIVMMDYDRCIGCRYCEAACPYGARAFNWSEFDGDNPAVPKWGVPEVPRRPRGVVEKCSFCYHRIDYGLELGLKPGEDVVATPACVVVCPVGARVFGNLNDPDSKVSQLLASTPHFRLREDMGTHPRVYYLPARNTQT